MDKFPDKIRDTEKEPDFKGVMSRYKQEPIVELTPQHERIIMALVIEGNSVKRASQRFKVPQIIIKQWRNDKVWQDAEDSLQLEFREGLMRKANVGGPVAIASLIRNAKAKYLGKENPPASQVNASREILKVLGIVGTDDPVQANTTIQMVVPSAVKASGKIPVKSDGTAEIELAGTGGKK